MEPFVKITKEDIEIILAKFGQNLTGSLEDVLTSDIGKG